MKVIINKSKDGMGNRIFSAITAKLYSMVTDRDLYIDWNDNVYSNDSSNSFNYFFDVPKCNFHIDNMKSYSVFPEIWKDRLNYNVDDIIKFSIRPYARYSSTCLKKIDYKQNILVAWMCIPEIYMFKKQLKYKFSEYRFKSENYIIKDIFNKYFVFNQSIINKIKCFKEKYFLKSKILGVQIRYTDKKINLNLIFKKINYLFKKSTIDKIFLATDNNIIIDKFKKKYNNIIFTSKWFPEDDKPLHNNDKCKDKIKNGEEVLIDLLLLKDCDYLLYSSKSSFARLASILSDIPEKNKIDIARMKFKYIIPKIIRRKIWEITEDLKLKFLSKKV